MSDTRGDRHGSLAGCEAAARRVQIIGLSLAGGAFVLLVLAAMWPIRLDLAAADRAGQKPASQPAARQVDVDKLVDQTRKRLLIKPAQRQAAVKDDGTAAKLLAQLKLYGVVQQDGEMVAYIELKGKGVQTCRASEKILEFEIKSIESGAVHLCLEGVDVTLRQ